VAKEDNETKWLDLAEYTINTARDMKNPSARRKRSQFAKRNLGMVNEGIARNVVVP
jgi:hypothetical protein